ncbi:hypothetical protein B0H10DRAFT_2037558 [Mycena sp. CBHHK59/15]|nr:hypothetical protein B0H10DRAFT_2037558 [Mycena sp. CBHHK59/15]
MSGIGTFFSSFFPTTHADSDKEDDKTATEAKAEDAAAEEAPAEEEEPEDAHPAIRAACEERPECAPLKHHFEKCQEKGEECVEEIMMHCSEACAAPQVFAKLR